jgi:tripartite-type tricarboxylate transporter receptor subunit TctC
VVWGGCATRHFYGNCSGLNNEINAGLADPKLQARFAELGAEVFPGSSADFSKLIASEIEKWSRVIRTANIKTD